METRQANDLAETRSQAERGNAQAQVALGRNAAGAAVPDWPTAARWYQRAADQGHPDGQYLLASCYLHGHGVPQDLIRATRLLQRAADQGHAGAQDSLGVRYATGQGVTQNDEEAVRWFRRAADQGHVVAQFNLGLAYAQGKGVPLDLVEAYAWFCLSAELGDSVAAGAVETVVESLSIDDLRRARTLFHKRFAEHRKKASSSTEERHAA